MDVHTSAIDGLPLEENGVPNIHRYSYPSDNRAVIDQSISNGLKKHIKTSHQTPDIIQVGAASPAICNVLRTFKKSKKVFVGTMVEPTESHLHLASKVKQFVKDLIFQITFDHVIVSSSSMAKQFYSKGIPEKKLSIIPSGVDTKRFSPATPEQKIVLKQHFGLPADSRITLFVGNLIPRKGIDQLLRAWKGLVSLPRHENDILFVIGKRSRPTFIGEDQQQELSSFQTRLDKLIAAIPPSSIKIHDQVSPIEWAFQVADLFVFPSLKEGLPNAVMEAMACGLPVATSRFIGFPHKEFGQQDKEFTFLPNEESAMVTALSNLLKHENRRHDLGASARQWTESMLDLEKTLDCYSKVYHNISHP